MIDVTKTILDTRAKPEDIDRANEGNEWKARLEELSRLKSKRDKKNKGRPPKLERARTSPVQTRAIRRGSLNG